MMNNIQMINEGIYYNNNSQEFVFDYQYDNDDCLVKLKVETPKPIYKFDVDTYFGCVFEQNIDHELKKDFIHEFKFFGNKIKEPIIDEFIAKTIRLTNSVLHYSQFDTLVFPQSRSPIVSKMVDYIYRMSRGKILTYEMLKQLPKDINFDYECYIEFLSSKGVNTKQINQSCNAVEQMMDEIHNLEYFSIGRDCKAKYRKYLKNFYYFSSEKSRDNFKKLQNNKIIVIDDISTTHTTMEFVLSALRKANDSNYLAVFCLLGNDFLNDCK